MTKQNIIDAADGRWLNNKTWVAIIGVVVILTYNATTFITDLKHSADFAKYKAEIGSEIKIMKKDISSMNKNIETLTVWVKKQQEKEIGSNRNFLTSEEIYLSPGG